MEHRAGWDATFSAPSVSLTAKYALHDVTLFFYDSQKAMNIGMRAMKNGSTDILQETLKPEKLNQYRESQGGCRRSWERRGGP
ncbi:MAG TPA: hypothetical protein VN901_21895 [Candidatus Acidoferrales bacterium]|nr:hypothetical protein [Candidatus Acidoferrales bacterium]